MTPIPALDFESIFETAPGLYLVLLPDLTIAAVSDTYLQATMTKRDSILGHGLFEVFPDNPDDNEANGVLNLRASLNYVLEQKQPHRMAIQKYDIRQPNGVFEIRYWSPLNTPVFNAQHELVYIIHNVTDVTIRQRAEEKLKRSEKDYQLLVNSVKDYAIFMVDPNGCVASWNSGAESIKGYAAEEIIGKPTAIFYTAEDIQQGIPQKNLQIALEKGHYETEGWRVKKNGSIFYANIIFTSLVDNEGKHYGYAKVTKDITDYIKAEAQLKEFEYFFNNSNDLSCIANTEGYFEIINPSFNKVLGYSQNELSKKPFIDFVHPDDIPVTLEQYEKLKSGATVIHFINRYRKKDGGYLWFDWNATPNTVTGKLYCIARDITDRKKAEDALSKLNEELEQRVKERTAEIEKTEKRFRALLENNYDIISLVDESFKIIYRSPSAIRITGWTDEDTIGKDGTVNLHPDEADQAENTIQEVMLNPGKPISCLFRSRHKDGHYLWMEGVITNLLHDEYIKAIVFNFRDITQRKELEDLLHKANVLARIGGWEVDLIKGTVYWSNITREIHETDIDYVPDLATGINFYKEGKGRDLITQKVKEAIELGKPWDAELQIITAKNNERWIRTIGETEFADGKCVRIYGSFQDIDERKKTEQALLRSEARARKIFESDMIGFIFWSEKGQILEANDHFLKMTGYTKEDLEKGLVNWAAMTPPEYANLDSIALEQIAGTGICKPFEKEYIRKDGSRFPIMLGAAALGDNFDGVGVCYVMDITERIKAAETIAKTLKEKNIILESIADAFFAVNKDWTVTYWNRIAEIALGVLKPDIIGKNLWEIFSDSIDTVSYKNYCHAISSNEVVHFEDHYPALNRWYEISAYPSENGLSVYFKDITDRKKADEKIKNINIELEQKVIRRTEQLRRTNEELEAFSYSVSHDLRAPLRAIVGYTAILEEDYGSKLDDEARRLTTVIKSNTVKMGNLIDDLLAFSRMSRHEMLKTSINNTEMVKEIISEMGIKNIKNGKEIVVHSLPVTNGDSNMIRQVWVNFISNAVKYSSKTAQPHIEIGSYNHEGQPVFFIKDNGVGFDEKYKNKLFKVFHRLHNADEFEGTGIGLALVEKIISKHGGKVWAEATVNKGAAFYFSLPG